MHISPNSTTPFIAPLCLSLPLAPYIFDPPTKPHLGILYAGMIFDTMYPFKDLLS